VLLVLIGAGLMLFSGPVAQAQNAAAGQGVIEAYTEPSKRLELAFSTLGVVQEIAVKEGDPVKAGQLLITQYDEVEALELERLKAEAESPARIEAAKADLDVKTKTYERKSAAGSGVYNEAEIEEAQLDKVFREKQLDIAHLDQNQNVLKMKQQAARVDRMGIKSRIDGLVEKIEVWEGEMADPSKPAIIVVKNDPLYIVIKQLRTHQVSQLKVGDALEVKYPDENTWTKAKITFISPVADAASKTQFVRLEMPNPSGRATGLPILVKLPDNLIDVPAGEKTAVNR
jgi:RND family efflux transporter MFP subunit